MAEKREKKKKETYLWRGGRYVAEFPQNPATTYHLYNFPPYLPTTRIIIHLFLKDTIPMKTKYHIPDRSSNKQNC